MSHLLFLSVLLTFLADIRTTAQYMIQKTNAALGIVKMAIKKIPRKAVIKSLFNRGHFDAHNGMRPKGNVIISNTVVMLL